MKKSNEELMETWRRIVNYIKNLSICSCIGIFGLINFIVFFVSSVLWAYGIDVNDRIIATHAAFSASSILIYALSRADW